MKFLKFWLPLLIWVGLIFYLSNLRLEAFPVRLLDVISSYLGHFFEYTILGFLSFRAFNYSFSKPGGKNFLYAGSFSILYALSDEYHQSFVPTRFCSLSDILVDILGIVLALFLIFSLRYRKV